MKRRSFFNRLGLILGVASLSPTIFIPKFEPVRWKVTPAQYSNEFVDFLIRQTAKWDEMIMEDIRPPDGWVPHLL